MSYSAHLKLDIDASLQLKRLTKVASNPGVIRRFIHRAVADDIKTRRWRRNIHPHYQRLLHDHHLLQFAASSYRLTTSAIHDFILCACLCFPNSLPDRLPSLTKFVMWLFFFDDFVDDPRHFAADPAAASAASAIIDAVLGSLRVKGSDSDIIESATWAVPVNHVDVDISVLNDLKETAASWWGDFQRLGMAPPLQLRFLESFRGYTVANLQQTQCRRFGRLPPDLPAFRFMRANSSGVLCCCILVEFGMGADVLSNLVGQHHDVDGGDGRLHRSLHALCFNAALEVGLYNDLRSLPRELAMGDYISLVPYLYAQDGRMQQRKKCGGGDGDQEEDEEAETLLVLDEAVRAGWKIVRECGEEARRLEAEIGEALSREECGNEAEIHRFVSDVGDIVGGLNRWQEECVRYAA